MDTVKIGADGIDAAAIVETLRKRAMERMDNGEFDMDAISCAERYNIAAVKDSDEFFSRFLSGIRSVSQVDINAWEIVEHRKSIFAPISKFIKKTLWSLLRFYTYHLWSQQNRSNDLLHTAIMVMSERNDERYAKMLAKIEVLEKRIAELEAKGGA